MRRKSKWTPMRVWATVTLSLIITFVIVVGGYVGYVVGSYSRLDNNISMTIWRQSAANVSKSNVYSISTFNIGFGAYSQDFSFFMDSGTMLDGTKVSGKYAKAKDKDTVLTNTNGAIDASIALQADFMFFQEVDTKATRSREVDQLAMLIDAFPAYSYTFAQNYDSAYLLYPFNDPIGKSKSGIVMLSKYYVDYTIRHSLPLDTGFSKFFDLDRCLTLSRLPIEGGGDLVLINVHLSAYDEGGTIRQQQFDLLRTILESERKNGSYVIVGGDFNHDIADSLDTFATQQYKPDWVFQLSDEDLPQGYSFAKTTNAPTCRSTDLPYTKGVNYTVVIDGFIVSDNIVTHSVTNIDLDFKNSDHNPVLLEFAFA